LCQFTRLPSLPAEWLHMLPTTQMLVIGTMTTPTPPCHRMLAPPSLPQNAGPSLPAAEC
jgi:hypothetical protein